MAGKYGVAAIMAALIIAACVLLYIASSPWYVWIIYILTVAYALQTGRVFHKELAVFSPTRLWVTSEA
jgi:hypothetical protein